MTHVINFGKVATHKQVLILLTILNVSFRSNCWELWKHHFHGWRWSKYLQLSLHSNEVHSHSPAMSPINHKKPLLAIILQSVCTIFLCTHRYKGISTLADKKRHLTEYNTCPEKNQHQAQVRQVRQGASKAHDPFL